MERLNFAFLLGGWVYKKFSKIKLRSDAFGFIVSFLVDEVKIESKNRKFGVFLKSCSKGLMYLVKFVFFERFLK